jgi:hypothetical protein
MKRNRDLTLGLLALGVALLVTCGAAASLLAASPW